MGPKFARRRLLAGPAAALPTLLACLCLAPNAQALSEQDFLADLPIVLSASRLAQPKDEAPAAITVIDREMIEASTAVEITELLQMVAGFQVGKVSGLVRSVTSHGIADQFSRRMQVLVDGRSIYDPAFGGVTWESIPISIADVERIEVVRGPNAASYGANAFLGAINIVTRRPDLGGGTRVRLTAGSQDTLYADVARDWSLEGGHALQLSAGTTSTSGFDHMHDGGHIARFNARLDYRLNTRDNLQVFLGASQSRVESGFPADTVQPFRTIPYNYNYQQLRFTRKLLDGSDLSVQLYHNRQRRDDHFDFADIPGTYLDLSYVADRTDAEIEWRTALSDDTRLVLGGGWRLDEVSNAIGLIEDGESSHQQFRLFAHGEHRLDSNWILQGGLMAEHFEEVGNYLSPRISLSRRLGDSHTLRLSAARGHRLPALVEQNAAYGAYSSIDDSPVLLAYVSAPNISAEVIDAFEIGLIGRFEPLAIDYDVKVFRHRMHDLIDPESHSDKFEAIFNNIGRLDINGLELQLSARPGKDTRLYAAYSLASARGVYDKYYTAGVLVGTRDPSSQVPRHTLNLLLTHDFAPDLQGSINYLSVADQVWDGDGGYAPSYNRVDLKLAKTQRIGGADARFELILQNAFDQAYIDFREPEALHPGNVFERRLYGQLIITSR